MKFDSQKHHRRSIRLKEYDYTQPGGYFVTSVTYQRDCLFGEIVNKEMRLNEYGNIVNECWCAISDHFPNVELGAYVVMPNHVHGVIVINDTENRMATNSSPCPHEV
jgi:REP element-mobilizing transposase RayT